MYKQAKSIAILGVAVLTLLTACATTTLHKPLPANSRIGIISTIEQQATFELVSSKVSENETAKQMIPHLGNFPYQLSKYVAQQINQRSTYKAIPIDASHYQVLSTGNLFSSTQVYPYPLAGKLQPPARKLLDQLTKKYKLDTIIIIAPGAMRIDNSNVIMNNWGVLQRRLFFWTSTSGYWTYAMIIMDAHTHAFLTDIISTDAVKQFPNSLWSANVHSVPEPVLADYRTWLVASIQKALRLETLRALRIPTRISSK